MGITLRWNEFAKAFVQEIDFIWNVNVPFLVRPMGSTIDDIENQSLSYDSQ